MYSGIVWYSDWTQFRQLGLHAFVGPPMGVWLSDHNHILSHGLMADLLAGLPGLNRPFGAAWRCRASLSFSKFQGNLPRASAVIADLFRTELDTNSDKLCKA